MHRTSSVILCLAYLLGVSLARVPGIAYVWLLAAGVLALAMPRIWRKGPRGGVWFVAGLVGFLATVYLQGVIPKPAADDIARYANHDVTVQGRVMTQPTLNRNDRLRFVLAADRLLEVDLDGDVGEISLPEPVSGQLYVTVSPEMAEGVHPGRDLRLTGWLYEPQAPRNPTGFDFRQFFGATRHFCGIAGRYRPSRHGNGDIWLGLVAFARSHCQNP